MAFERLRKLNRRINKALGIKKAEAARLPDWMQAILDGDIPDWYREQLLDQTIGQIGQIVRSMNQPQRRLTDRVQLPPVDPDIAIKVSDLIATRYGLHSEIGASPVRHGANWMWTHNAGRPECDDRN